ncbi:MAG TPA: hypothetical protein VF755_12125 [Catenuloplanes sp.]
MARFAIMWGATMALIAPTTGALIAPTPAPAAVPRAAGMTPFATTTTAAAATMTTGYAAFDRQRGVYTEWHLGNKRFRSASIVKLLIALDLVWYRNPDQLPVADRRRLAAMLRSSNDSAASYFWVRNGDRQIVQRMAARLGLTNTVPPPPSLRGWWGYTAMSARDTIHIYRFILERARKPIRDAIMWQLHHATERGSDGFYQNFGLMTFTPPRSVKQGWSGFGDSPPPGANIPGLSLWTEALHTTGTVGPGDRYVAAVFTLHPRGTPVGVARDRTTRLTRSLG